MSVPDNFQSWTTTELCNYLKKRIPDMKTTNYDEIFIEQKIDGSIIHRLNDKDLQDMGITILGDRHRILHELEQLQKVIENQQRDLILWEGDEVLYFNCIQGCIRTCCGCCPNDPDHYKLTNSTLTIISNSFCRCGPMKCCFGHETMIDNIDLSHVYDVDLKITSPTCTQACCCGTKQATIIVMAKPEGKKQLTVRGTMGHDVTNKIRHQVETVQKMDRGNSPMDNK